MSNDYKMEFCLFHVRQFQWKLFFTIPVQEKAIRVSPNPSFSSPNLICRLLEGSSEPSVPIDSYFPTVRKFTVLIRKNNDMVFKNDERGAYLFSLFPLLKTLIAINAWGTPEGQESSITQAL